MTASALLTFEKRGCNGDPDMRVFGSCTSSLYKSRGTKRNEISMFKDGQKRPSSKTHCLSVLLVLVWVAVGNAYAQTPACMAKDLSISFHFHNDALGEERITLLTRNISGHNCLLTASSPPSFVPAQQTRSSNRGLPALRTPSSGRRGEGGVASESVGRSGCPSEHSL
jgi:hypothetical protein